MGIFLKIAQGSTHCGWTAARGLSSMKQEPLRTAGVLPLDFRSVEVNVLTGCEAHGLLSHFGGRFEMPNIGPSGDDLYEIAARQFTNETFSIFGDYSTILEHLRESEYVVMMESNPVSIAVHHIFLLKIDQIPRRKQGDIHHTPLPSGLMMHSITEEGMPFPIQSIGEIQRQSLWSPLNPKSFVKQSIRWKSRSELKISDSEQELSPLFQTILKTTLVEQYLSRVNP